MSAYHQMGHDSWNLLSEPRLGKFRGAVLSPVNDSPESTRYKMLRLGKRRKDLEMILDPQLYKPRSDRGELLKWDHFDEGVETSDLADSKFWMKRGKALCNAATHVSADAVCSPAMQPKIFDESYVKWTVEVANNIKVYAEGKSLDLLISAVVPLDYLSKKFAPESVATALSDTDINRVYLVFTAGSKEPRDQLSDTVSLIGAGKLISLLESAGMRVLTAFSGIDVVLWKAFGCSDVSTGKFFNLRRFVPGRWEEEPSGGRVMPYWTDARLLSWLREDDLRLLKMKELVKLNEQISNPYAEEIFEILESDEQRAWVGIGWRQYMWWFAQVEELISNKAQAKKILREADKRWGEVEDNDVVLFDRKNTGVWIRSWLNVLNEQEGQKNEMEIEGGSGTAV